MDAIRTGLSIRALRRRRAWTQAELGRRARLSASAISRIERGQAARYTVESVERLTTSLGAHLIVRILWQGEELDRLLDGDHARLVEWVVQRLRDGGWTVAPEVTFQVRGERGSIDVFARHVPTGHLLVVEVKSVMPDVQAMLAGLDRKARLAPLIGRDRGWAVGPVSRVLVLPDDRTARRRLAQFAATFDRALPARTVEIRRWLPAPARPIAGVVFVANVTRAGTRHRVGGSRSAVEHGRLPGP